ncbi:MAG: hypothetical protein FJ171_04100 [Gammaproteobacteria bacterium]|nr:hypothetical protein [Gammaproteobacteria bacterium]
MRGLGQACASLSDTDHAIECFHELIRLAHRPLPIIDELARFCLARARLETAVAAYQEYLSHHPGTAIAHYNCGYYSGKLGKHQMAIDHYLQALQLGIDRPEEVHLNIANVYADALRDDTLARKHLDTALSINTAYIAAHFNLGHLAEQRGELEEAQRCFWRCLQLDASNDAALARLADTCDFARDHDALFERLLEAAGREANADLHFSAGRACEQRGDYVRAWQHFTLANESDRRRFPIYDPSEWERRINRIISVCDADWIACRRLAHGRAPLFICGMFRSGSTLVEQILAAHPSFTPAGELEFFPRLVAMNLPRYPEGLESLTAERLASWAHAYATEAAVLFADAARVTDKRPDNFLYLGLIKAMFPQAQVVVVCRDWRDVALSVYTTRLGPVANYATDLTHTRHYIRQHDRLLAHWQSQFGADMFFVSYQRLVAEPRPEIERLLQFLGEPWDDRCLEFHQLRNTVRTASVWQVRRPLYVSSVGRWRRYQERFAGLLDTEDQSD